MPDEFIDRAFAVMALCPQHTFLVLTKRPERMLEYMKKADWEHAANTITDTYIGRLEGDLYHTGEIVPPLPNVLLGTSVKDQDSADKRLIHLVRLKDLLPGIKIFASYEPAIGAVDFTRITIKLSAASIVQGTCLGTNGRTFSPCGASGKGIDWLIMGGESGPGARPMHPDWARSVRDQCKAAGVPFFFKQWGEWMPIESDEDDFLFKGPDAVVHKNGTFETGKGFIVDRNKDDDLMRRVGKSLAGCHIDGVEHKELPRE